MKVLLVEDDLDLGNAVHIALRDEGITTVWVRRLADAEWALERERCDLVVLDLGLPDGDGMTLVRRLQRDGERTPVLILTARDALEDRLHGLDSGADDYVLKPFALAELLSRIRALARRSFGLERDMLEARGMALHLPTRRVSIEGRLVDLSRSEFELLAALMRSAGRVVTRRVLEDEVLPGGADSGSNVLDVHMSNLRRKIGEGFIRTLRGVGYVIDIDAPGLMTASAQGPLRAGLSWRRGWQVVVRPSLTRRLLLAQMLLLTLLWATLIGLLVAQALRDNPGFSSDARYTMIIAAAQGTADRPEHRQRLLSQMDAFQREEGVADEPHLRSSIIVRERGEVVYASPGTPTTLRNTHAGVIEEVMAGGTRWRVRTLDSPGGELSVSLVLPADAVNILLSAWSGGFLITPLLISLPFLVLPAWLSVRLAMRPWRQVSEEVAARGPRDLSPLVCVPPHRELRPLVDNINTLLQRVRDSAVRERSFIADAAHELRTPLAAIRANVEALARHAGDPLQRRLMAATVHSSERAARLVAQLLSLMRTDAAAEPLLAPVALDFMRACSTASSVHPGNRSRAAAWVWPSLLRACSGMAGAFGSRRRPGAAG